MVSMLLYVVRIMRILITYYTYVVIMYYVFCWYRIMHTSATLYCYHLDYILHEFYPFYLKIDFHILEYYL